ncbi:hypothetical protein ACT453_51955, partial [Bacillus sp. D-CC]
LFLYKHYLFIGTKIHAKYGGVWLFNLETRKLKRIKIVMKRWCPATIHPFLEYGGGAPSIRSLFLYKHYLFIGTKIHAKYGGVWLFN